MMALWAVVSALTAVADDFVSLLVLRFFLGLTEAPCKSLCPLFTVSRM